MMKRETLFPEKMGSFLFIEFIQEKLYTDKIDGVKIHFRGIE